MGVLLIGAVACITALILSAWLMTFARWFPIKGIDGEFLVDYKTMISSTNTRKAFHKMMSIIKTRIQMII